MACACRRAIELDCHPQQEPSTHAAHEVTAGDSDRLPQIRESGQDIFKAFHAKARESTFPNESTKHPLCLATEAHLAFHLSNVLYSATGD